MKNPLNIGLITTETILSPIINPSLVDTKIDLELSSLLTNGFRAAGLRKAQITDPTISPQQWALKIFEAVENFSVQERWRALPPLAGILQASSPSAASRQNGHLELDIGVARRFQQLFVLFINSTLQFYISLGPNSCQIPSTLMALASAFPSLEDDYKNKLSTSLILPQTVELVYASPFGLNVTNALKSVSNPDLSILKDSLNNNPVLIHLNSYSLLIQHLVENTNSKEDSETVYLALKLIWNFTQSLSSEYQHLSNSIGFDNAEQNVDVWRYLKLSLFSLSVSFQGYSTWLLQHATQRLYREHAVSLSSVIIKALSNVYFIVAQVSLAGFPTYDFVYYSSMDILLDSQFKLAEISSIVTDLALPYLTVPANQACGIIESSLVNRGKLIFLLNMCELLTPLSPFHSHRSRPNTVSISGCIMPLCRKFLTPPNLEKTNLTPTYFQPVLESAHSVFLSVISTPSQALERNNGSRNKDIISDLQQVPASQEAADSQIDLQDTKKFLDNEIPSYLNTVLDLFPIVLSPNQFTLAIKTIIKAFSPPSPMFNVNRTRSEWILNQIYTKARYKIHPGKPLPASTGTYQQQLNNTENESSKDSKNIPIPTTRAVVISALIHSLPFVEISLLQGWLDKVLDLIEDPSAGGKIDVGPAFLLEKQFLEADLFQMISEELEQYKATVGIRWWFRASL